MPSSSKSLQILFELGCSCIRIKSSTESILRFWCSFLVLMVKVYIYEEGSSQLNVIVARKQKVQSYSLFVKWSGIRIPEIFNLNQWRKYVLEPVNV